MTENNEEVTEKKTRWQRFKEKLNEKPEPPIYEEEMKSFNRIIIFAYVCLGINILVAIWLICFDGLFKVGIIIALVTEVITWMGGGKGMLG